MVGNDRTRVYSLIIAFMLFVGFLSMGVGLMMLSVTISSSGTLSYSSVSPLHTQGQDIYDALGNRVKIYAAHIQHGNQGAGITKTHLQKIKAMGFNAIRIAMYWGKIQTDSTDYTAVDPLYFTSNDRGFQLCSLDNIRDWCVELEMYIILYGPYFSESYQPPTWAFKTPTSLSTTGEGTPDEFIRLIGDPTNSAKERAGMAACWKAVGTRYRDCPNFIFEFLNEPVFTSGLQYLAGSAYKTFNEILIDALMEVENQLVPHLKVIELCYNNPSDWQEIVDSNAVDVDRPNANVVWGSHPYAPSTWHNVLTDTTAYNYINPPGFRLNSDILHNLYLAGRLAIDYPNGTLYSETGAPDPLWVAYRLARVADKIHSWNKPWLDTEAGKISSQPTMDVWFDISCGMKADPAYNSMGWTLFCYCPVADFTPGYNINNPTTQSLVLPILQPWMIQP